MKKLLYLLPVFTSFMFPQLANSIEKSPEQKVVAHWSFDSTSDSILFDVTGNGLDAYVSGNEYVKTTTGGVNGNALECKGEADENILGMYDIQVKNSNQHLNLTSFSIEVWAYAYVDMCNPGSYFHQRAIFENSDAGPDINKGYCLKINYDGRPSFAWGKMAPGSWWDIYADSIMRPNKWYHFVATLDSSFVALYVNGKIAARCNYNGEYPFPSNAARIGCQWLIDGNDTTKGVTRQFFNGKIDELKFYSFALDSQTILANYNALKPVEEPPFEINIGMKTAYAKSGDTVVMPVYYSNHETYVMTAAQLSVNYNPEQLTLLSVSKDSGLVSNWELFDYNTTSPGVTKIAMGGTSDSISYGEGELFRCTFQINSTNSTGDTCTISLSEINIDENDIIQSTSQNGRIIIMPNHTLYGDVTANNQVNVFDAQKVLSYIVGLLNIPDSSCPNFTTTVADVSGNGSITSYDAALILQYGIGLISSFPVELPISGYLAKRASISKKADLKVQYCGNTPSGIGYDIIANNMKGFYCGEFSIKCGAPIEDVSKIKIVSGIQGAKLDWQYMSSSNILKVAVISNDDIDTDDQISIISILLPTLSPSNTFSIHSALLNEGDLITNYLNKGLRAIDFSSGIMTAKNSPRILDAFLVNKTLKIAGSGDKPMQVQLWNLNGRLMQQHTISFSNECINLSKLPRGTYLYKVSNGISRKSGKIMITQ